MSNSFELSELEKAEAIKLLKSAGCSHLLTYSVGDEPFMYKAVLESSRSKEDIQKIFTDYEQGSKLKWEDIKEDREMYREFQKTIGLW